MPELSATKEKEPLLHAHSHYADKCWRWWLWPRGAALSLINLEASWRQGMWIANMSLGDEETQLGFTLAAFGLFLHAGFNYLPIPKILTHYFRDSKYLDEVVKIALPRCLDFGIDIVGGEHPVLENSFVYLKFFSKSCFGGWEEYFSGPSIHFSPFDWLFGEIVYQSTTLQEEDTDVAFPEYSYPVHIEIRRDRWSRPRYWGELVVHRCDVSVPENGVPIPTGEYKFGVPNDTYALCCLLAEDGSLPDNAIEVAKQKMIDSTHKSRAKHHF